MLVFFSIVHVVLAIFMIFVILLQPGKDAGMGAALGGGAATSAFGGRGAVTFLSKLTAACAVAFFVTSLGLSFVGLRTSVMSDVEAVAAPAAPSATPLPEGAVPSPEANTATPAVESGGVGEAPGKAAPTEEKPGATDAVPADRLPK